PREAKDLDAVLDRTLAQERDAFHLGAELIRPPSNALVGVTKPRVVRLDPLGDCVQHLAVICANVPALNVGARRLVFAHQRAQLLRRRLAGSDLEDEVMELHAIRARGPPDQLEGVVEAEAVPFGQDALRLLDRDARLERLFELGPPLVGGLRDREQTAHGRRRLFGGACPQRLDRFELGLLAHGVILRPSQGAQAAFLSATVGLDRGQFASRGVPPADSLWSGRGSWTRSRSEPSGLRGTSCSSAPSTSRSFR